jgi:hypothetical protein
MTKEEKTKLKKDISAVDEVLGWDPRGDDEEYKYVQEAVDAFTRIKKLLKQLDEN